MELILNNPKSKPSARIERWNLRLQDYQFNVVYTKGQYNPSDFFFKLQFHSNITKIQLYVSLKLGNVQLTVRLTT